jgi:OmcA/MtrC family decaheme c-type cytochrome
MACPLQHVAMRTLGILGVAILAWSLPRAAPAVSLAGGGSKKNDCLVEVMVNGAGFPSGGPFTGTTCADGDPCDGDGVRNGVCVFTPVVCVNVADPALPKCNLPAQVSSITIKGKFGKGAFDTSSLDAAVAGLGLPQSGAACSPPADLVVPVTGYDKHGAPMQGTAKVKVKGKTTKGVDKDNLSFVCRPGTVPAPTTTTIVVPTTTVPGATTSTTTSTLPGGTPAAGLVTAITNAAISAGGQLVVTFTLTDAAGVAVVPTTASTSNPNQARVRFTIARLEVLDQTAEGFTTTFTRYRNYITGSASSGSQPTYDTPGTFALVNAATGTWTYTFGKTLPADLPRNLTHTIGAQIERTVDDVRNVANPIFDFVPDGSAVTTRRELTTTAECNQCHNPLALHGGGRREVRLCQLCHTDQSIDPDSGNQIDFKHLVHRIHMGKDLPSIVNGAVGDKYEIIGNNNSENIYAEKVNTCASGPFESVPCTSTADCAGSPCTGTSTTGVGFPQDVRNCTKCHGAGATAADHQKLPSALACTGCHDDVNPGETTLNGLAPGTGHVPGPQPDAFCRLCHTDTQGTEFDITVPGAHVIPTRSATLAGLSGEILGASGAAGGPVTITFRIKDGSGTPLASLSGMNRVAFALSGPTSDFGGASVPLITPTAVGGGANGTLTGPDVTGVYTYATAASLPADAARTWRVGLEARRNVTVNGQTVSEALQNPVLDFSVDGSPVVARRTVVETGKCAECHGTFSKDFSVHGNLRNQVEYCIVCHNPNETDGARRKNAVAGGADPDTNPITFKEMIHKIHRGEELERQPYIVYGFGAAPKNYGANDFGEVRFPGDLRDCETCHATGTQLLPLDAGLLPTVQSTIVGGVEQVTGHVAPITNACTSCHDSDAVAAHAETNTTASGAEACAVCHGEGAVAAVSVVHAVAP